MSQSGHSWFQQRAQLNVKLEKSATVCLVGKKNLLSTFLTFLIPQSEGNQGILYSDISLCMPTSSCKLFIYDVYNKAIETSEMKPLLMIWSVTFVVCGRAQLLIYYTERHVSEVL